jgi:integrase
MTGTIITRELKDGTKRYDAVWRVDGKQKWRTFNKRKAAERFLTGAVKATHEGTYQDVTPALMSTVFERWLTHSLDTRVKQAVLKPSTAKSYKSMLATHLRPAFDEIRSDRLRAAVIVDWARNRAEEISDGDLAPKTYNNILNLLSAILTWARQAAQSYLAHDPLTDVHRLPRSKVERAFLEPGEITELLTAADDVRDSTILATAVYSGLRRGELFGLQWSDVDWVDGRIRVQRSLYQGAITTPKTAHSIRTVDVPASLLACLSIYRAVYPPCGDGFIFRTDAGATLDPDNWSKRALAPILERAEGVPAIGLHGLRHTYASLLINQGEHIKYVSQQLGHASITITADLYGHLFRETSSAAMRRLDARKDAVDGVRGQVVPIRTGTHG